MRRTLKVALIAGALTLALFASISVIGVTSSAAFAGQDSNGAPQQHRGYSLASLNGNYAFVGIYAGRVAANLGVVTFDGLGTLHLVAAARPPVSLAWH